MSLVNLINFFDLGDERGSLISLEGTKNIPFDIKRVYYIFATNPGVARGFHAHRALKQVMVCVSGKCTILLNNGKEQAEISLNSPDKGILIEGMVWREMHDFSDNCVLLVVANEHYDEDDYIRDYGEFLRYLTQ